LKVSLGFFEDVSIPDYALQQPSYFDEAENIWIWKYEGASMYMDIGEEVRFRVSGVRFNHTPGPLQLKDGEFTGWFSAPGCLKDTLDAVMHETLVT
jgi:DNA-directed RNA polymerase subunit E'/Rpb7